MDTLTVLVDDVAFSLDLASIHPGPPGVHVVFSNIGRVPHTLTFFSNPGTTMKLDGADTGFVQPGQTVEFTFVPPHGATKVYFLCEIHPTQQGGSLPVQ